ncbi:MAG TPA: hypothetical protein VFC78_11405, partial [Tepidisphaeraceae bacterium]|nr:hypothetical protein [Tepidisphaeraceae bacterium]
DGVAGKFYEAVMPPIFSPDSRHMAYRAAFNGKFLVVNDGVESEPSDIIGRLTYSPDSRHLLYLRMSGKVDWLMVDGKRAAGPFTPASTDMRIVFDSNASAHFTADIDGVLTKVIVGLEGNTAK